jgi:hypothetical protein
MLYGGKDVNYFLEVEAQAFPCNNDLKIIYSYGEGSLNDPGKKAVHVKAKIPEANYSEKSNAHLKGLLLNFKSLI